MSLNEPYRDHSITMKFHILYIISYKMENIRTYNVGVSDYSTHKKQPWDFWEYIADPWRADIVKRVLRTNKVYGRKMDHEKIKHILLKIKDLQEKEYIFSVRDNLNDGYKAVLEYINDDIYEDYTHLSQEDVDIFKLMFENPNAKWPIETSLQIIDLLLSKHKD